PGEPGPVFTAWSLQCPPAGTGRRRGRAAGADPPCGRADIPDLRSRPVRIVVRLRGPWPVAGRPGPARPAADAGGDLLRAPARRSSRWLLRFLLGSCRLAGKRVTVARVGA